MVYFQMEYLYKASYTYTVYRTSLHRVHPSICTSNNHGRFKTREPNFYIFLDKLPWNSLLLSSSLSYSSRFLTLRAIVTSTQLFFQRINSLLPRPCLFRFFQAIHGSSLSHSTMVLSLPQDLIPSPRLRNRILYIDIYHIPRSLHRIPYRIRKECIFLYSKESYLNYLIFLSSFGRVVPVYEYL